MYSITIIYSFRFYYWHFFDIYSIWNLHIYSFFSILGGSDEVVKYYKYQAQSHIGNSKEMAKHGTYKSDAVSKCSL